MDDHDHDPTCGCTCHLPHVKPVPVDYMRMQIDGEIYAVPLYAKDAA